MLRFARFVILLSLVAAGGLTGCGQQPVKPSRQVAPAAEASPVTLRVNLREADRSAPKKQPEKPSPSKDNLWTRLFSLYQLPETDHPRIDQQLQWYAEHPEYVDRVQARARPYLYTIVEAIERSGLPGELALLPVVESAFQPDAYSRRRAAGLWQFIPSTGRLYGLEQNWWLDLRRDVHASTRAAIRYLKKLNADFQGDWLLALAAYNAGEGRVARAIRRNRRLHQPTDFWHLRLPRETRAYVPKLLAVARLFAHSEEYDMALDPIPNRPLYGIVNVGSQIDLNLAAELAQMPLEELYRLNPGFRRWATAPEGPHRLVLPLEKVELFEEHLAELPESKRVRWERYQVRRGETLSEIARHYQATVSVIRQINHLRGDLIYPGQALLIPMGPRDRVEMAQARPRRSQVHVVHRGDTLWDIARRYGVEIGQLARLNDLSVNSPLRVGQRLRVDGAGGENAPQWVNYTVREGDSLYRIALRFGVRLRDLRDWNRDRLESVLYPGQNLKVYLNQTAALANSTS
ncbi:MAG: LysM peptidoglycan-binding domain-containing protein [Methylohalobius sp. ZOD2]